MSRIGRKPINIPAGVEVKLDNGVITVKGPKGTLTREVHPNMAVNIEDNVITVTRPNDEKENRALHGLTRTLIANMVEGVTDGFKKELEVNGVGYRVQKQGKNLVMNLGYSHQVTSSLDKEIKGYSGNKEAAKKVGQLIAQRAAEKGISTVVFDRGGYIFHGRVKELAEGAREGGLKF